MNARKLCKRLSQPRVGRLCCGGNFRSLGYSLFPPKTHVFLATASVPGFTSSLMSLGTHSPLCPLPLHAEASRVNKIMSHLGKLILLTCRPQSFRASHCPSWLTRRLPPLSGRGRRAVLLRNDERGGCPTAGGIPYAAPVCPRLCRSRGQGPGLPAARRHRCEPYVALCQHQLGLVASCCARVSGLSCDV